MKIRIKKNIALEETSGAAAGTGFAASIGDAATIAKFNKDEEEDSRLEEMYSSQVTPGVGIPSVSAEDEFEGYLERSDAQGLQNVKRENEDKQEDSDKKLQEIQRFRKKMLNRAYAPFISGQERSTHISESTSFDDMDSIDREFFAGRSTIGDDASISKPSISSVGDPVDIAKQSLEEKGYSVEKELGKGMNGTVYLASNSLKSKCAIKIVIGDAADEEMINYQTISDARSTNALIKKHFPKVFETWSPTKDVAIIVMEVLKPLTNAQASFVPDASFLHGKNKPWRLAAAGDVYSGMRDMSKRFTHYIQNNIQYVASRMEYFAHQLTNDWDGEYMGDMSIEKMASLVADVSPDELLGTMQMLEANPAMSRSFITNRKAAFTKNLGASSSAVHLIEILEEESPESLGANAVFIQIAFKIMVAGLAAKQKPDRIDGAISDYAKAALGSARRFTQIPMGYNQPELKRTGSSHEREFLTSRGLHAAIVALHKQTGLMAKDLHDQNIMANAAGDLVIVDVGLFKLDDTWTASSNLQEMLKLRKKMLRNLQK